MAHGGAETEGPPLTSLRCWMLPDIATWWHLDALNDRDVDFVWVLLVNFMRPPPSRPGLALDSDLEAYPLPQSREPDRDPGLWARLTQSLRAGFHPVDFFVHLLQQLSF